MNLTFCFSVSWSAYSLFLLRRWGPGVAVGLLVDAITAGEIPSVAPTLQIGLHILSHLGFPPSRLHAAALGGAAAVVGDGGHVLDEGDLQAHGLQRPDSGLAALAGTLHVHFHAL